MKKYLYGMLLIPWLFVMPVSAASPSEQLENINRRFGVSDNSIAYMEDSIDDSAQEEIEGVDSNTLNSKILSQEAIDFIYSQIEKENPGTSNERQNIVKYALSYVGRLQYSQAYHNLPISKSKYSDCSGFASDIWKIQKETTASFYKNYDLKKVSDGGVLPGDILLYYIGVEGDGANDHCLIYAGMIGGEPTVIDCNNMGVRLRTVSYFDNCYYISLRDANKDVAPVVRKYIMVQR